METKCLKIRKSDDTIRYDSVYLTCSKKLTGSQLSPPHGTNKKSKCETKNKTMSMIGPVLPVTASAVGLERRCTADLRLTTLRLCV